MFKNLIEKSTFAPNKRLKASMEQFTGQLLKMKREVWTSEEITAFRIKKLDEIKRQYLLDVDAEKASLAGLLLKFKDVYLKKAESDFQEKSVRLRENEIKLRAMTDKELEAHTQNELYSDKVFPLGVLDTLSVELKNRKMKSDYEAVRKTIKDKKLDQPWLHLPESKPYSDMYDRLQNLSDNHMLVQYNDGQYAAERIDEAIKELEK